MFGVGRGPKSVWGFTDNFNYESCLYSDNLIFKLRGGASMPTFVGRSVGRSVCPSVEKISNSRFDDYIAVE